MNSISSLSSAVTTAAPSPAKAGAPAPQPAAPAPAGIVEISPAARQGAASKYLNPLANIIWGSGPSH